MTGNVYTIRISASTYTLSPDWIRSTTGRLLRTAVTTCLRRFSPRTHSRGPIRGSVLIAAEDLFFHANAGQEPLELINYTRNNLQADYQVTQGADAGPVRRSFLRSLRLRFAGGRAALARPGHADPLSHGPVRLHQPRHEAAREPHPGYEPMKLPDEAGLAQGTGGGDAPVCIQRLCQRRAHRRESRSDPHRPQIQPHSGPGHHRQGGQGQAHPFPERLSRAVEGHHRGPAAMAIQTVPA